MTTVVIVGAGKGERALLEMLVGDRTVSIAGIADLNPWAPGIDLARRLNLPIATELEDRSSLVVRELQAQAEADFIIGQNPKMREVAELPFRELGDLGYKFIFVTIYAAQAGMYAVWNAMEAW